MTPAPPALRQRPHRPEVDGLRTLAVMAVMLFHTGWGAMRGGYLGVDLFFVISGFLITGIVAADLAGGAFSLRRFYLRRARRILPALLAVQLLVLPVALWLLLPDDLENFGESLVATTLSANNLLLWWTADYFALDTQFRPLVHTWSLGVEEQFYALVPLALLIAYRLGRNRGLGVVMALLGLVGLGSMAWLRGTNDLANFYLLPSRLWELGLGGLAALWADALRQRIGARGGAVLAWAGLALALAPLGWFGPELHLPGWPSLVPALGAALLLVFAESGRGAGALLGWRWLALPGLASYSAYLWYQPLFAFWRLAHLQEPGPWAMAVLIPPVWLLAWLTWRWIEQPCRDRARVPTVRLLALLGTGMALSLAAGLALYATSGLRARWPELAEHDPLFGARQNAIYVEGPRRFADLPLDPARKSHNVLVIGNSMARDAINMGLASGRLAGMQISYVENYSCDAQRPKVLARARAAALVIVSTIVRPGDVPCAVQMLGDLRRAGIGQAVVIGPRNFGYSNAAVMLVPPEDRQTLRVTPLAESTAANTAARRALPQDAYIDVLALLDDGTGAVPVFTPDARFISHDRLHLTRAGAELVGRRVYAQPAIAGRLPR